MVFRWTELSQELLCAAFANLPIKNGVAAACVCREWSAAWSVVPQLRKDKITRAPAFLSGLGIMGITRLGSQLWVVGRGSDRSDSMTFATFDDYFLTPARLPHPRLVPSVPVLPAPNQPPVLSCNPRGLCAAGEHLYVSQLNAPYVVKLELTQERTLAVAAELPSDEGSFLSSMAFAEDCLFGCRWFQLDRWDASIGMPATFGTQLGDGGWIYRFGECSKPMCVCEFDGRVCVFDWEVGLVLLTAQGDLVRLLMSKADLDAKAPADFFDRSFDGDDGDDDVEVCMSSLDGRLYVLMTTNGNAQQGRDPDVLLILNQSGDLMQRLRLDTATPGPVDICATPAGLYLAHCNALAHLEGGSMEGRQPHGGLELIPIL